MEEGEIGQASVGGVGLVRLSGAVGGICQTFCERTGIDQTFYWRGWNLSDFL